MIRLFFPLGLYANSFYLRDARQQTFQLSCKKQGEICPGQNKQQPFSLSGQNPQSLLRLFPGFFFIVVIIYTFLLLCSMHL